MQQSNNIDEAFKLPSPKQESQKRKREFIYVFMISILLAVLVAVEVYVFRTSRTLPSLYAFFFIGLVNVNIVLVLLMLFLIFRNFVKVYLERKGGVYGSSLKSKLIVAFTFTSVVPTVLVFVISVFYINASFEKWFSNRMVSILKNASEVIDSFILNEKKRNYDFAHLLVQNLKDKSGERFNRELQSLVDTYRLDAVEFYPSIFGDRKLYMGKDRKLPDVPVASLEFLQKGLVTKDEVSTIHQLGEYNVLRVIVPFNKSPQVESGAIVVSKFLILSPNSKINDIVGAYQEVRGNSLLELPIKSIFLILLFVMTLVILFAATWFGVYLAKQISIPLVKLGSATQQIATGNYSSLDIKSGSGEIQKLIESFNQMLSALSTSEIELQQTLKNLNQYSRYIEVVLSNVSTGVISVDHDNKITTINRRACELLNIERDRYLGKNARELLTLEYFRTLNEMIKQLQENNLNSIIKEVRVNVKGESIPLLINLSILKNEQGDEIGRILVFDDLTPIISAQRSQAWTEVARRIAHEVKNPLTPIKLSAERLQRKFMNNIQDPAFKESTDMIIQQVEDMKNLVNEFSQFARLPQAKPIMASMHKAIEETLSIYRDNHPEIEFKYIRDGADQCEFKFDPDQIKRVFMNLLENSVAAVQGKKEPSITVELIYDYELKMARLQFIDNGVGIRPQDRNRVFEPYFTTKSNGTGLGLAIVKRIIEDHNGYIRMQAINPQVSTGQTSSGTIVTIELPLTSLERKKV